MSDFDLIVIGAGPGGYPAALRAAQLGRRVALVEKEALGGTCLNWGCIPTKTLLASAAAYHRLSASESMGVRVSGVGFDYERMSTRKVGIVGRLNQGIRGLLQAAGVSIFNGVARFEDMHRVSVTDTAGTDARLSAAHTIIATGSVSALPSFLPKHPRILESRAFLERTELPQNLIILGGGVVGCEFACLAAMLNVKVTVVEMLDDILMILDRDVRRVLRRRFETLGITVHTGAPLTEVEADDDRVMCRVGDQTVRGDLLLVAAGRRPETAALDLARAGVVADGCGQIPVDAHGRTSAASIFAVGDVTAGSVQLAHAATSQGIVAAENAAGKRARNESICPACIFTSPEVGTVGLSEEKARQEERPIRTGIFPFTALGKAMAECETEGFVKWIADARTDQLLGAQAVGAHATDLIAEAALAVRNELTVAELGRTIHGHPTRSEAWMEAAHAVHGECLHLPKRK